MNWLYYFQSKFNKEQENQKLVNLFLRPYIYNETNEMLVGERIVCINIYAMDYFLELKKDDPDSVKLYFEKLGTEEFNIQYAELSDYDKELYQADISVYLAVHSFTIAEIWDWIKKLFVLNNYPFDEFKEAGFDAFSDTNEIMRMFSLKNVKKFEDKFGKEWWKGGKK